MDLTISEDIRPVSDLKIKTSEVVDHVTTEHRPVVLTKHGRGVAVLLSVEDYEQLQKEAGHWRVVEAIQQAEQDIAAGRVISHKEVVAKWASRVGKKA